MPRKTNRTSAPSALKKQGQYGDGDYVPGKVKVDKQSTRQELQKRITEFAKKLPEDLDDSPQLRGQLEKHLKQMKRAVDYLVERNSYRADRAQRAERTAERERVIQSFDKARVRVISALQNDPMADVILANQLIDAQFNDGLSDFDEERFASDYEQVMTADPTNIEPPVSIEPMTMVEDLQGDRGTMRGNIYMGGGPDSQGGFGPAAGEAE
jgi:hypothetical protein